MKLDARIIQEIWELHERLLAEGKLLNLDQLDSYYRVFANRFGPNRLNALDGEELLDTMQNQSNRKSLMYWLEFKDDDELPAKFGSIAGGSALKFGVL